ncbi:MAG: thiamine diphosphokinase [Porphyromonadaceae bacterium CG2_30_38_12]|nr:MAG: thiamine diphosphokinase [Porphyromonadaceae bacterium CG2_30_38_12]
MKKAVVVANGEFPSSTEALELLQQAAYLICCDGAISNLEKNNFLPNLIIGDLDSISENQKLRYGSIMIHNPDQETNDLTKSIRWCVANGFNSVDILAATGKREDHTIGNIALLSEYAQWLEVRIVTDYGVFTPILKTNTFKAFIGQQVSIFSLQPSLKLRSTNLKYPLHDLELRSWWMGTLNEALADQFTIAFDGQGEVIVFQNR